MQLLFESPDGCKLFFTSFYSTVKTLMNSMGRRTGDSIEIQRVTSADPSAGPDNQHFAKAVLFQETAFQTGSTMDSKHFWKRFWGPSSRLGSDVERVVVQLMLRQVAHKSQAVFKVRAGFHGLTLGAVF